MLATSDFVLYEAKSQGTSDDGRVFLTRECNLSCYFTVIENGDSYEFFMKR